MSDRAPQYKRRDDGVSATFTADDGTELMFYATDIRREGATEKAYVKTGKPGERAVDMTDFKLRDADKYGAASNRAAFAIWKKGPRDDVALALRERMMLFVDGLFAFWLGEDSGQEVSGDKHPSAPPWAVPGLVLEKSTNMWVGAAGANKSTLLRLVAQSLRYGLASVIPVRGQANVIFVNAEEPPEEHKRQMGNVNAALGLDRTSDIFTIDARALSIQDLAPRVEAAVAETRAEHVFVDSLSRLARGMNLNDNATATLLVDSLAGIDASVTWLGHTGHENTDRMAGSKHFENAARLMVLINSRMLETNDLVRGVRSRIKKGNGLVPTEDMFWTLRYDRQYGLTEAELSDRAAWPVLHCDYPTGEDKMCNRRTWDGVLRNGHVRCSRHLREEEEE